MRKPLTAAVLLSGHLLLAFVPTSAHAAVPAGGPAAAGVYGQSSYDDHYRCMYHCEERGYGRDGYDRGYDRNRYDHSRYDHSRYDRYRDDRVYHNGQCWQHDAGGSHQCGDRRYGYRRGW